MPTTDFAALGVPTGRYALPPAYDFLDTANGTPEGSDRIRKHYDGKLPLSALQPAEVEYIRKDLLQQATEQRQEAVAHFAAQVPRRFAAARADGPAAVWAAQVAGDPYGAKSLLLVGPTGTGKTHYAYAVLRAVAETGTAMQWRAFTSADLYAHLRPHNGRDNEAEFEKIASTKLLVVDDLGAAKLTEWTEEVTYRLINHRYEQCLPGIFTTNVPPAQLGDILGGRIASRLAEMCERVPFKGSDRRKGGAA